MSGGRPPRRSGRRGRTPPGFIQRNAPGGGIFRAPGESQPGGQLRRDEVEAIRVEPGRAPVQRRLFAGGPRQFAARLTRQGVDLLEKRRLRCEQLFGVGDAGEQIGARIIGGAREFRR